MTFREVLFRYIDTNAGLSYDFRYGYATKIPCYVMQVVSDPELSQFVCKEDGETGNILIQFKFAADQKQQKWTQFTVEDQLEELKDFINNSVLGRLEISGNAYIVYNVRVSGIQPNAAPDGEFYGARFEAQLSWEKA
jgi:hypothetical protein